MNWSHDIEPRLVEEATALCGEFKIIDLHLDTLIPYRLFHYDLNKHHAKTPLRGNFFGHFDFPQASASNLNAAMWSITTNPFQQPKARWDHLLKTFRHFQTEIKTTHQKISLAKTAPELNLQLENKDHVCLLAIQGGNSLQKAPEDFFDQLDQSLTRVTIVHLTNSVFGATSSPLGYLTRKKGLTREGHQLIERLNHHRIFVDLAHAHPALFWDTVRIHDRQQPLICTHTGVNGVRKHWRNLDDSQLKAIAESGGTIGVMFEKSFLNRPTGPLNGRMVVEHIAHIIKIVGEDHVSIGSDYDGFIRPPRGLGPRATYLPLVAWMLERRFSEERIAKILSKNFLRCFEHLRPHE